MNSDKFERILSNQPTFLSQSQLLEFQGYCSARNLPLDQLIDASLTLYQSDPAQSYSFLSYLERHELPKPIYNDYLHQPAKVTIYNNLSGMALAQANKQTSKQDIEKLLTEAKRLISCAEKVRMMVDKSVILNRAFMFYYGGDITKALNLVSRIYQEIQKTGEGKGVLVTATLLLAQINFVKKNYQKALDLYKKCLEVNKTLPTKARIGMAYSFFYLGKYEMARACFQRILKLDPNCVQAYIGIGIVYQKQDSNKEYFSYISKAYSIDKRHPLVLLHLAEHFLYRRDMHKTIKFCELGLTALTKYPKFPALEDNCRNDHEDMKARFHNIIAQTHHIHSNYIEAIKYYTLASGKGLIYNEVLLAQSYINPNSLNYIEAIRLLQESYKAMEGKDGRLLNDSYRLMAYLKSKVPPKGKQQKGSQYYYTEAIRFNRNDFDSKIQYANILVDSNKTKALKMLQQAQKIQIANGHEVKPELQNNIAVLYLQNGEPQTCQKRLQKCMRVVDSIMCEVQQQQIRKQSLQVVTRFNYGICMEKQFRWHSARQIYQDLLKINKYHIDTTVRLAYVWYQLGSYHKIGEIFQELERVCNQNKKIIKFERIANAKAYIQHLSGSSSEARQTLKTLGKQKDLYTQIFDICITYEGIMRKGVQLSVLKQFLRPNRQFCYKFCREDVNATFAYMLLAIILLADKKFTKAQGIQFFNNLKQFSSDQLPSLLYNMAYFLMNYDDYDNSNLLFNLYKDKVGANTRTDQLIALNHLLQNNLLKAEGYVKRNILREPCNLKYKLQYSYILERRSHQYYQKGSFKRKEVEKRLEQLKFSMNTHQFFGKVNISDTIRGIECPELKERIKTVYLKVKSCGEERKFYIKSYMDSFEKVLKDLADEEVKKIQEQRVIASTQVYQDRQLELQRMLEQVEEQSQDEEERERKELQKKKQRALEFAKRKQAEMDNAWNELKIKDQEMMEEKKSRKRGPRTQIKVSGRKRQRKDKQSSAQFQEEHMSLPQQQDEASYGGGASSGHQEEPELDQQGQARKKHKHDKKKKKKDKHRHKHKRQSEDQLGDDQQMKSQRKQPEQDGNDEELQKYMI